MARKADPTVDAPATRTISLTVDHVHMPVDLLSSDWESTTDTARYPAKIEQDGKLVRAKYEVHAALADFLIGRDQAIEVPTGAPEHD